MKYVIRALVLGSLALNGCSKKELFSEAGLDGADTGVLANEENSGKSWKSAHIETIEFVSIQGGDPMPGMISSDPKSIVPARLLLKLSNNKTEFEFKNSSCRAKGSLGDDAVDALLEELRLASKRPANPVDVEIPDLESLELVLKLKNGTNEVYDLDGVVNSSVRAIDKHQTLDDAKAVLAELKKLAATIVDSVGCNDNEVSSLYKLRYIDQAQDMVVGHNAEGLSAIMVGRLADVRVGFLEDGSARVEARLQHTESSCDETLAFSIAPARDLWMAALKVSIIKSEATCAWGRVEPGVTHYQEPGMTLIYKDMSQNHGFFACDANIRVYGAEDFMRQLRKAVRAQSRCSSHPFFTAFGL